MPLANTPAWFNTVLRAENDNSGAVQQYWNPSITGSWAALENNIVSAKDANEAVGEGTNGIKISIGSTDNAIPTFSAYGTYFNGVPGTGRYISEMKPKAGTAVHWDYGGAKVGAWERSEEIFSLGIVPGNVGWPVAEAWERAYNGDGGVATNYTGSYDNDGNAV